MRRKKDPPHQPPPLPAMFVGGDGPAEEGDPMSPSQAPAPVERPSLPPAGDVRSRLQDFFALPPAEAADPSSPKRATDADESDGRSVNGVGCLAVLVLAVVSGFVEDSIPLSDRQKMLAMGGVVLALLLVSVWVSLHDSDLAYRDRDADGRMARFRNRLREIFNIPVI